MGRCTDSRWYRPRLDSDGNKPKEKTIHTVTIVARNYLARTYREHNPNDSFTVVVVDAERGEVSPGDGYAV